MLNQMIGKYSELPNGRNYAIQKHVLEILKLLDEDPESPDLKETPRRVANYLLEFLGYEDNNTETVFESITTDQMVIVKNIPFYSLCSHHMLPFSGKCSVGYITGSKVIGLSKIPRIVQKFAHKLQIQERMAHQIADELEQILDDALGIIVVIEAFHTCMQMRGIKSQGQMVTSVLRGDFRKDPDTKKEFFLLTK